MSDSNKYESAIESLIDLLREVENPSEEVGQQIKSLVSLLEKSGYGIDGSDSEEEWPDFDDMDSESSSPSESEEESDWDSDDDEETLIARLSKVSITLPQESTKGRAIKTVKRFDREEFEDDFTVLKDDEDSSSDESESDLEDFIEDN